MDKETALLLNDALNKMALMNDFVTKKTIVNYHQLKDILNNEKTYTLIKNKNEDNLLTQKREVVYYNEIEFLIQCYQDEKILVIPVL